MKKCFTSAQVDTLAQLLKLNEQGAQMIHAASQYIEYGPEDIDPAAENLFTKKDLLSKRIGDMLAVMDHLVETNRIDVDLVKSQRNYQYQKLSEKWKNNG